MYVATRRFKIYSIDGIPQVHRAFIRDFADFAPYTSCGVELYRAVMYVSPAIYRPRQSPHQMALSVCATMGLAFMSCGQWPRQEAHRAPGGIVSGVFQSEGRG